MSVWKGHEPIVIAIAVGLIKINVDGEWSECTTSEGFMEVRPDKTQIFAQAVEWPEEIDLKRAQEAAERAKEKLRQKQSYTEHKQSQIALARAMVRMRVGRRKGSMGFLKSPIRAFCLQFNRN